MGFFDFFSSFGRPVNKEDKYDSYEEDVVTPFVFTSNHHQRYENNIPVMGLQNHIRTIRVEKNTNGCRGYDLEPGRGYIVKVWNDEMGRANMSDKPMDLIKKTDNCWVFRGFPIDAESPFGWVNMDYQNYGFIVFLKNGKIEKCQLHMYDRNTYIEYLE